MEYVTKPLKIFSCVNINWLPIKANYFLIYGISAGFFPFISVIGKFLGLSATAVGVAVTFLPITVCLFRPFIGLLSDYTQDVKKTVMCLQTVTVVFAFCLIFLERIGDHCIQTQLRCTVDDDICVKLSFDMKEECVQKYLSVNNITTCNISYQYSSYYENETSYSSDNPPDIEFSFNTTRIYQDYDSHKRSMNSTQFNCFVILKNASDMNSTCKENYQLSNLKPSCGDGFDECIVVKDELNFYYTYQFWSYTFIVSAVVCCGSSAMSLIDVACCELLADQREYYGRQRLWGTISYGLFTLLVGYFNDLISGHDERTSFIAGYCMMVVVLIPYLILLSKSHLPKNKISGRIVLDIIQLFHSVEFIVFIAAVFLIGSFSHFIRNYLFWHLTDLGANQALLGWVIAVQSLAEIPFFFFSGWFIKHLGYFNCLTSTFVAFALRYGIYSILQNPWLVLTVEGLNGLTFGIFYAACAEFASSHAPPGTEGTVFGLLGGICEGLGGAVGNLLGGLSFSNFGGSKTFLIACCISVFCVPVTFVSHIVFKKRSYNPVVTSETEIC